MVQASSVVIHVLKMGWQSITPRAAALQQRSDGVRLSGIFSQSTLCCVQRKQGVAMRFVLLMILLSFACAPVAQAADLQQQRELFMQARQALDAGQLHEFNTLKQQLVTYPLTPYLEIWQVWKQLDSADEGTDKAVAGVLQSRADIPEAGDLRKAWAESLAARQQWAMLGDLLEQHPGLRKARPELAMMSDWYTGRQDEALREYSRIWPRLRKQPDMTMPLHQAWLASGHPTTEEQWEHIIRLARSRQWKVVEAISGGLEKQQKQWLSYWRKLQSKPQKQFEHWPASLSHPARMSADLPRAIFSDGMQRLARQDPIKAHATLHQMKHLNIAGIDPSLFASLHKQIALRAAKQHLLIASKWLAELPEDSSDEETRSWQTRLYLLQQDWENVSRMIARMPPDEQQLDVWQYWKARALDAMGTQTEAQSIYAELALGRGYYSFLAAERAGLPYRFNHESLETSQHALQELADRPGMLRAREWLALGSNNKAGREWNSALAGADEQTWRVAASLAASWDWPDQAILAAYRGRAENALTERFPLQFQGEVMLAASQTGLQPSSIWSIIRQESIFNSQATSNAGARGLMQLMPRTAKMVAKQMGLSGAHRQLFTPQTNIQLGSRYLADMKSRFNDNLALAAAAYNAGPYRVGQWLKSTPFELPDIWVEAIPFNETRRYVQQVMAYTIVYQWRGNQQHASLMQQLQMQPDASKPDRTAEQVAAEDSLVLNREPADTNP